MASREKPDFAAVHSRLKTILKKYETGTLKPQPGKPTSYCLIGPPTEKSRGKDVWFGAVQTGKAYVSYHLMPVYAFPDLLEGMSPELRKRMQGKSCFNFRSEDPGLFRELAKLTEKGYRRFRKEKLIV